MEESVPSLGDQGVEKVIPGHDRFEITNTYHPPYSAICFLQTRWPDGGFTAGTGLMFGPSTVFTCGHLLFDPARGGLATKVVVAPGVTCGTTPFDSVIVDTRSVRVFPDYQKDRSPNGDLGAILLPVPLGKRTGWPDLAPIDDLGTGDEIVVTGYTAERPNSLQDFHLLRGVGRLLDRGYGYALHDASATTGQSGGPVWRTSDAFPSVLVCGFHKGQFDPDPANYMVLLTWRHYDWIQARVREANGEPFANIDAKVLSGTAESERTRDHVPSVFTGDGALPVLPEPVELLRAESGAGARPSRAGKAPESSLPAPDLTEQEFRVPARGSHAIDLHLEAGDTVKGKIKVALPAGTFTDCDLALVGPDKAEVDHLPMFVSSSGAKDFHSDRFSFAAGATGLHRLVFKEQNGVSAAIVRIGFKCG